MLWHGLMVKVVQKIPELGSEIALMKAGRLSVN